jgi:tRNA (guanine-N7-)-methyltransferase
MYGLQVLENIDDVHAGDPSAELRITTHYESLDIAQSKRVHYLSFVLPATPLPDLDARLLTRIKEEEPTPGTPVRPARIHSSKKRKEDAAD